MFCHHISSLHVFAEVFAGKSYTEACDMWSLGCITFIMLTGEMPFVDDTDLAHAVMSGDWNRDVLDECNITRLGREFISCLLVVDPQFRLTAKEALTHPWLKETQIRARPLVRAQSSLNSIHSNW